jgi:ribonuclease HI
MEDNIAWHFDPKGVFSVKSDYKLGVMLRDRRDGRETACSKEKENTGDSDVKFSWKKIWDLRAPNKLKFFVWRLSHNSLASRMKIKRLGVDLDTACPVCHRLNEDGGHVFLKCKMVKACWSSLGLADTRDLLLPCNSAQSMLEELWKCDTEVQLKALTLMWEWWGFRNKVNSGDASANSLEVCHRVEKHMVDFKSMKLPAIPPKPPDQHKWAKPPDNQVKVNFDGAFDYITGSGGWGYIIRDQAGDFVAAGSGKSVHLRYSLHSEAVACLAAINGAIRIGANRIIFESDASNLVQALKSTDYDKSSIGVLMKEARSLCVLNFALFQFSYARRTCNTAAHVLAKIGVSSESSDSFWEDYAPICISDIIASDSAVLEM